MEVIVPPAYPKLTGPVIFLAGPIQGGPDWQTDAIIYAADLVHIANPRRVFTPNTFEEQVEWETHWLNRCGKQGVILFWLANQATEHPERVYAQTTRFELGEWLAKKAWRGDYNLVVGIDSKFQGAHYIRHRIAKNFSMPVHDSLKDTMAAAVEMAVNS